MTTTIEIKIECKGQAIGTLGWFNSMMQDASFVIKEGKSGAPCMFLKAKNKGGDGWAYSFIAKKWDEREDPYGYLLSDDGFLSEISEGDPFASGFSNYPLTPACKIKVEEMIQKGTDAFREWWNNDK